MREKIEDRRMRKEICGRRRKEEEKEKERKRNKGRRTVRKERRREGKKRRNKEEEEEEVRVDEYLWRYMFAAWIDGFLVQWNDSCLGCKRSRVRFPEEPISFYFSIYTKLVQ